VLQVTPILTTPQQSENLLLYITATTHVISTTIVVERQEEDHAFGVQRPVDFVSEVLSESKVCYPSIQDLMVQMLQTSPMYVSILSKFIKILFEHLHNLCKF
jgi:hypothetical protein